MEIKGQWQPPEAPNPLTNKPWRYKSNIWTDKVTNGVKFTPFNQKYDKMVKELKDIFKGSDTVKRANVLLIGPISSGKSAFVNSVLSIGSKSVLASAHTGKSTTSYTNKLGVYLGQCAGIRNIKLFDTMGLEDIHVNDVTSLLEGHVLKDYAFNPKSPITPADKGFKELPDISDRIHLVVFCIKDSLFMSESTTSDLSGKVALIQNKIKELDIPRMVLLTHVDEICPEVSTDIEKIFHSKAVEKAVRNAENLLKVPSSYIHPVVNYHRTTQTNKKMNLPLLLALQQMLAISNDYFQRTYTSEVWVREVCQSKM